MFNPDTNNINKGDLSGTIRSHRPVFHSSPLLGLDILRSRRAGTIMTQGSQDVLNIEMLFEGIRSTSYPSRPSRLASVYASPNILSGQFSGKGKATYAAVLPKKSYFITDASLFEEGFRALSKGFKKEATTIAHAYWKGPQSFGQLRGMVQRGTSEILVPNTLPVKRVLTEGVQSHYHSGLSPTRLAQAHAPVIEGLAHGGWAARLRRIFTAFGSGWQGVLSQIRTSLADISSTLLVSGSGDAQGPTASLPGPFSQRATAGSLNIPMDTVGDRLLKGLSNPHEASQVANELFRHSIGGEAKYLGSGIESVAFSLGGGKVGKLSSSMGKSGFTPSRRIKEILHPLSRSKFGKTLVEISPQAVLGGEATDAAADALKERLAKKGYSWLDPAARNVGLHEGQIKIIDYGHVIKSKTYQHIRDYGAKKGLAVGEITDLVRRHSRTVQAIQPKAAANIKRMIDMSAANRSLRQGERLTAVIMKTSVTRSGAGLVTNAMVRIAKTI